MMHVLFNGSFWAQPTVGSGQYLHGLLRWLPRLAPQHRYTVLLPATGAGPALPAGVRALSLRTPFDDRSRNLAKVWFEQVSMPQAARLLGTHSQREGLLLHVPYFAPPLRSSIVPLVTTIPDIIPLLLPEYRGGPHVRAYMQLVRRAARAAARIITFSQHSRSDIARWLHISPQRITTTLLAADERYTLPADQAAVAAELATRYALHGPYIYYVGGLDARKNVAVLLQAAARLQQQGRLGAPLVLAGRALGGDPRLFPDLDGMIAELGLAGMVRRIEVPHADGPLLYQGCTAFAFPSHYEGFGLPPLEAMACGAPVVVSTASSLPEVVGDAALQVAPDDVAGWAAALERLLREPSLRADLRARGLAQAARFSWRRVAEETLAIYQQVLT